MESIAILGLRLLGAYGIQDDSLLFALWLLWAAGLASYFIIMPLVIYRLLFRPLKPADWSGPHWICMGAAAIITLAGSEIFLSLPTDAPWEIIRAATGLLIILTWIIATVCIPFQIAMDMWKHTRINLSGPPPLWIKIFPWARLGFGRRGETHFFEPPSWGRVFPMGMYAACTLDLAATAGQSAGSTLLQTIPRYWIWYALAIWALTFIGTTRAALKRLRSLIQK
jgi:tellurite resistance protein TehA-like permease